MRWLLFLLLVGCSREKSPALFQGVAMTIEWRILVGDPHPDHEKIRQVIEETFDEVNALYNRYNPHSELTKLNQAKGNEEIPLSPKLYSFLKRTGEMVALTEGRFDPTVLPALLLKDEPLPIGWEKLTFTDTGVVKEEGVMLDLGGIAKGYAIDLLIERLGYQNLFVEWGGEMRAIGKHPEGRDWTIAITNPLTDEELDLISLNDLAVATSGDYLQKWKIGDKTVCHIVDPKTHKLREVKRGMVSSATIVAPDCFTADAFATSQLLLTPKEAKRWALKMRESIPALECYLLSEEELPSPEVFSPP